MNTGTCIIIGGGMGGLFAGALLAKNGIRVTVLEKNAVAGGGLQSFRRNGIEFDTGMHVMGGLLPGGNLHRICSYLGILARIDLHHINPECMDEILIESTGDIYRIPSGREAFVKAMSDYFPDEAEGIRRYVDELYRITSELPLYYLKETDEATFEHSENFNLPADRLIARYVSDPKCREILAYLNPLYSGMKGHSPAYIHALINVLYINGTSRFKGGSLQLVDALCDVIRDAGGDVVTGCEVTELAMTGRHVDYVSSADGRRFSADTYISDIHPSNLLGMTPPGAFPKAFANRLNEIPDTCSAFSIYIEFHPESFPYIPHTCYAVADYGMIWNQHQPPPGQWPASIMYMTPPVAGQGDYASHMLIHTLMDFNETEKWRDTVTGRRGTDYELWKRSKAETVIRRMNAIFPGFADCIKSIHTASPLTIRDFYATRNGSIFGYREDAGNPLLSRLSVKTKIDNLLLTGQNVSFHGNCGVPLTAINTAEAILGRNFILRQINSCYENIVN